MNRGVTCTACGASTALPSDLRVPTFACQFCQATLSTAAYAGASAVSADALVGHLRENIAKPTPDVAAAVAATPRFQGQSSETRAGACLRCKAPVQVPLDLTVRQLTCGSCGATQPVSAHISDGERLAIDMQRQVAGNQALAALRSSGVACPRCGGKNDVPGGGAVQVPCRFCGHVILLGDHVDASAVARSRLKEGVFQMRDEIMAAQKARDRTIGIVVGVVVTVVVGIALALVLFTR
jgi:hypothetical protein